MPDEFREILRRELDELKQNKIRVIALGVCFIILLVFWITDDGANEEEILITESPSASVTKDLPVKNLPVAKTLEGVKVVLGANADGLFISDPFAGEEKPKPAPVTLPPPPLPKIPAAPTPPIVIQPPTQPPTEKIILMGTAISGANKTAMFLRGNETLFLTIGEEIGGLKISDITPDFVTFEDGKRIYFQKELE